MKKSNIYSDIIPYLVIAGGLLFVLFLQVNWVRLIKLTQTEASQAGVSLASSNVVSNTMSGSGQKADRPKSQDEDANANDGKMKRIGKAVKKLIQNNKDKSGAHKENGDWGYLGQNGPEKWGDLASSNHSCKKGKMQSPVRLVSQNLKSGFVPLFYYKDTGGTIENNGHTLKVTVNPGSFLQILGKNYFLKQFHFHTPSEHIIDGREYPMVAHLVHESHEGHIVVVAIMFTPVNEEFNRMVDRIPLMDQSGMKREIKGMGVDPAAMLPPRHSRKYFAYDGSLTTPPCTENIGWIVMKTPVPVNLNRINRMRLIMKKNKRPVQPLNGRIISYFQ